MINESLTECLLAVVIVFGKGPNSGFGALEKFAVNAYECALRKTVPVYINNFNLPTYTRRLVDSLIANGFANIVIIDQASEGVATQCMLDEVERIHGCRVIRRRTNKGPRYFFDSLAYLFAEKVFFYTDPDIELPSPLPSDFVSRLLVLSKELKIGKVGCALDISDSHLFEELKVRQYDEPIAMGIAEYENRYWLTPVRPDVFDAKVDTTLALYNRRYFHLWHFFKAVRVAGEFTIKHRPWYKDKKMPANEAEYYAKICEYSSWLNTDLSGKNLFKSTPPVYLINKYKEARWRWWQIKGRMAGWAKSLIPTRRV
ncbi:hypothetical protein [Sphingomonas mollis]|uniref:Glycosyltransferase n=1 Tax=Sphingomonas mollis TaxID=2795726 RepID=A0ABS0XLI1_9SPHN|nr:hypothetical protein [Sphingomonas sp. BT553]MBJ6120898.1 hypothetical protein [Sphingomonas sp. BT553]